MYIVYLLTNIKTKQVNYSITLYSMYSKKMYSLANRKEIKTIYLPWS